VLLSSIEGAAITAVKIDGVLHEFSPIQGSSRTPPTSPQPEADPLKMHVDYTKTLILRVDKPGIVRAKDIEVDHGRRDSWSRRRTSPPCPTAASCTWSCA
jgi:DNA-directed RNA polymerase subunit alpha